MINFFNRFENIFDLSQQLKTRSAEKASFDKAQRYELIPRITKSLFINNIEQISAIEAEIGDIKKKLNVYTANISEITNREILELKREKDKLLKTELELTSRVNRVQNNISESRFLKSKHLKFLKEFFPDVNVDRLEKIEQFHDGLSVILKAELVASEKEILGIPPFPATRHAANFAANSAGLM